MIEFHFGLTTVQVWPKERHVRTVFADGAKVTASPEDTPEYRETAARTGYGSDTWKMCFEHELFHTVLAMASGRAVSPTLWIVAHGTQAEYNADLMAKEESEVLEFQRKLNECFP